MQSLTAQGERKGSSKRERWRLDGWRPASWRASTASGLLAALTGVALTTWLLLGWATRFHLSNVAMAYLLVVLGVATTFGRGPAIVAAILAFLAFDMS